MTCVARCFCSFPVILDYHSAVCDLTGPFLGSASPGQGLAAA